MGAFTEELLSVDRDRLDLRAGLLGLAVVSVAAVAVLAVGPEAMAAAVGALVVLSTGPPPVGNSSTRSLLLVLVAGTGLTLVAVAIGGQALPAAVLVGVVGTLASMHAGRSRKAGIRSLVATLWVIVALTLNDTEVSALHYAAAFGVGAVVGAAVVRLRARPDDDEGVGADDVEPAGWDAPANADDLLRSPLGQFALLRGLALAIAVALGFTWFPAHPVWPAITALIVLRPPTHQALVVGLQRSIGTGVGVVVAVALAGAVGENRPGQIVLFLASAFLMMAVREVNYAVFAMVVASLVVYLQRILGADAAESGRDRVVETILGVAIAFVVLAVTEALARHRSSAA